MSAFEAMPLALLGLLLVLIVACGWGIWLMERNARRDFDALRAEHEAWLAIRKAQNERFGERWKEYRKDENKPCNVYDSPI